jgi:hypothetical protein
VDEATGVPDSVQNFMFDGATLRIVFPWPTIIVDVALVATTDAAQLAADIEYASRGPLDAELFHTAC